MLRDCNQEIENQIMKYLICNWNTLKGHIGHTKAINIKCKFNW